MHQHRAEHLVVVDCGAVAMMLLGALRAVDRLRGEVAGAVEREQIVADRREHLPRRAQQPLGVEVLAAKRGTHQNPPRSIRFARKYTDFQSKI